MKVLVTGATGFLGSQIIPALWAGAHEVTALDIREMPDSLATEQIICDLTKPQAISEALGGKSFDATIHLAAAPAHAGRDQLHAINVNATRSLLMELSGRGGRVILASSSAVYGRVPPSMFPVKEDCPPGPIGLYGKSFSAREGTAKLSCAMSRADLFIMRVFNLVGPGQEPVMLIPEVARKLALVEAGKYKGPLAEGPLTTRRDYIDSRDAAVAFTEALSAQCRGITILNICTGTSVPGEEIVCSLAAAFGIADPVLPEPVQPGPGDIEDLPGDPSAANRLLSWKPVIPLEQSLREVAEDWRGRVAEGKA
jgi:GDP-4-dehydro-6-deoxy-D-mannose reductase